MTFFHFAKLPGGLGGSVIAFFLRFNYTNVTKVPLTFSRDIFKKVWPKIISNTRLNVYAAVMLVNMTFCKPVSKPVIILKLLVYVTMLQYFVNFTVNIQSGAIYLRLQATFLPCRSTKLQHKCKQHWTQITVNYFDLFIFATISILRFPVHSVLSKTEKNLRETQRTTCFKKLQSFDMWKSLSFINDLI